MRCGVVLLCEPLSEPTRERGKKSEHSSFPHTSLTHAVHTHTHTEHTRMSRLSRLCFCQSVHCCCPPQPSHCTRWMRYI
jgi:hypothetical protein